MYVCLFVSIVRCVLCVVRSCGAVVSVFLCCFLSFVRSFFLSLCRFVVVIYFVLFFVMPFLLDLCLFVLRCPARFVVLSVCL